MGEHVIVHRFEDQQRGVRGQRRVTESRVVDVDADDHPDWVKKALDDHKSAKPQRVHTLDEADPVDSDAQPAAVFDSIEFGADPNRPEGLDEPVDSATAGPDPISESMPAAVFDAVPFNDGSDDGSDGDEDEGDGSDEGEAPRSRGRRSAKPKDSSD